VPMQNLALVLDNAGMHYIFGKEVVSYASETLRDAQEVWGSVYLVRSDGERMIPNFAFHSRKDAKAFVAAVVALRGRQAVPGYNWSAYNPGSPEAVGNMPAQSTKDSAMRSSKPEIVARCIWISGIIIFCASIFTMINLAPLNGPNGTLYIYIGCGFMILGGMLVAGGVIAGGEIKSRSTALTLRAQGLTRENFNGPLVISLCDTSRAVLTLLFTLDYKKHMRLNNIYNNYLSPMWLSIPIIATVLSPSSYFLFHMHDPRIMPCFVLAWLLLLLLLTYNGLARTIKQNYPRGFPEQNVALVLGDKGIHLIIGGMLIDLPWSAIKGIRELDELVILDRYGACNLIPMYAFQRPEDASAFVATVMALKKGQAAPPYDWSAYPAELPEIEGVWPPSIK